MGLPNGLQTVTKPFANGYIQAKPNRSIREKESEGEAERECKGKTKSATSEEVAAPTGNKDFDDRVYAQKQEDTAEGNSRRQIFDDISFMVSSEG